MNLINELLIIAGCEPLSETEISEITGNNTLPNDFVNAVYNIVDIYEQVKDAPTNEQLKYQNVEYDTTLLLPHKDGPLKGRTSKIFIQLGLSDSTAALMNPNNPLGSGLLHADKHRKEFGAIVSSLPQKDKQIINSYVRNNNPMEFILLSIPFIIKGMQYHRLGPAPNIMKDATLKCRFIYGDAIFVFYINLERNIASILTVYHATKDEKARVINQNKLYRNYISSQTKKGS